MKYIFFLTFSFSILFVFGQEGSTTEKLVIFLGQERYNQNINSNPGLIENLSDRIEFGYEIIDYIPEKSADFKVIEEISSCKKNSSQSISPEQLIELHNSGDFIILNYDLPFSKSDNFYLKLGETGKAMIIYSQTEIARRKS